jgi:hypothetical protein
VTERATFKNVQLRSNGGPNICRPITVPRGLGSSFFLVGESRRGGFERILSTNSLDGASCRCLDARIFHEKRGSPTHMHFEPMQPGLWK